MLPRLLVLLGLLLAINSLPAQPLLEVGHYGENIGTVAVDGTKGVCNEGTRLRVFDMTTPTAPVFRGAVDVGTVPTSLFVVGDYAYVSGYTGPFSIVSITNMDAPTVAGVVDWGAWVTTAWVRRVADFAYVGVCSTVEVIDVRNKALPLRVRDLGDLGACIESITGDGGYLYVVSDGPTTRVRIYSLANPASPLLVGTAPGNSGGARRNNSVAVFGDTLYVGQSDGTMAYDVADRTQPRLIGRVEDLDGYYETVMDVDRGLLYVADWGSTKTWQLAAPDAPTNYANLSSNVQHMVRQLAAISGVAFAARTVSLTLTQAGVGTDSVARTVTPTVGYASSLAASGTRLYVGTGPGIATFSTGTPTQPALVNHASTRWSADLDVIGATLYSASPWGFLEAYSIADPDSPTFLAEYPIQGDLDTLRLSLTSSTVCLTANDQLVIYTRAANGLLTERSRTLLPAWGNAVAMSGSMAYVAIKNGTMRAYDVTNPASPSLVATRTLFGSASATAFNCDAEIVANRLHVLIGRTGYAIVDVTAPTNPTVLGTFPSFEMEGADIAVVGNTVYLATFGWNGLRGIRVLDVSNPSSIQQVATTRATGLTRAITIASGYLYSAEDRGALRVRNLLTSPSLPASGVSVR